MTDLSLLPTGVPTRSLPLAALPAAGFALAVFALGLFSPILFNDGDTLWHIRAGEWMLAQGRVLQADPFSFTFANQPWTTHEWLAEIFAALAWRWGGAGGVAALHALAYGVLALLLFRAQPRGVSPVAWLLGVAIVFTCLLPGYLARPHVLVLPVLAGWTMALLAAREKGKAPPLALALLLWLWANLHGSWAFGVALAGFFALEALLERPQRWRAITWDWGRFGAACLLAAAATPHGVEGLLFPLKLKAMGELAVILEWRPLNWLAPQGAHLAVLGAGLVLSQRAGRPGWMRILLLAGLFWMMVSHQRHQMLFAIVGLLVLAQPMAKLLPALAPVSRAPNAFKLFAAGACLLVALRLGLGPAAPPPGPAYPAAAIAAVPASLRDRPMLNQYGFGGALIFSGMKPFIDGRADLFGDAFLRDYVAIIEDREAAFDVAAARYGLEWAILRPEAPIAAGLARRGWDRLYADEFAVIYSAPGATKR